LLTTEGWLGETNFGGTRRSGPAIGQLLTVRAAGTYIVPPKRAGEQFPGDHILGG
jgi:deferrochelatase/peroxidase EfeB